MVDNMFCAVPPMASFLSVSVCSRPPVWLSAEGVAVLPVVGRPSGRAPLLRVPVAGLRGRRPRPDLAEGVLPQEDLRGLQGVPGL